MWKRNKDLPGRKAGAEGSLQPPLGATFQEGVPAAESGHHGVGSSASGVTLGSQIAIKGELTGSVDLTIEGRVEGKIELPNNILTIGAMAHIKAEVFAKAVIIFGDVTASITATEKVEIHGSVKGDVIAPRIVISDGACFRGSIDMQPQSATTSNASPSDQNAAIRELPQFHYLQPAFAFEKDKQTTADHDNHSPEHEVPEAET